MQKSRIFSLILFIVFMVNSIQASHNRAGEIVYEQIGDRTILASIITYSRNSSISADRDSLIIDWGDGKSMILLRVNGADIDMNGVPNGEILYDDYQKNIYSGVHEYAQEGEFLLSMIDPNREPVILNVDFPNSDAVPFYLETKVFLGPGENSSPVLLQDPINVAFVGSPFVFVPDAFDLDDDSLSFELIAPLMASGIPVNNYQLLTDIVPGSNNKLTFNDTTGMLIWNSPQREGIYNIAYEIKSYRNGQLNGSVIRDMQILVFPDFNSLATIEVANFIPEIVEVEVGDVITLEMSAMDVDVDEVIEITSTSGLYDYFDNVPDFEFTQNNANSGTATFSWTVMSEHIRRTPYNVIFKVSDDDNLANFAVARFKVKDNLEKTAEINAQVNFKIYPNPASEIIFIESDLPINKPYEIWNAKGQLMAVGNYAHQKGIEFKDWPNGIYYLGIEDFGVSTFIKK